MKEYVAYKASICSLEDAFSYVRLTIETGSKYPAGNMEYTCPCLGTVCDKSVVDCRNCTYPVVKGNCRRY